MSQVGFSVHTPWSLFRCPGLSLNPGRARQKALIGLKTAVINSKCKLVSAQFRGQRSSAFVPITQAPRTNCGEDPGNSPAGGNQVGLWSPAGPSSIRPLFSVLLEVVHGPSCLLHQRLGGAGPCCVQRGSWAILHFSPWAWQELSLHLGVVRMKPDRWKAPGGPGGLALALAEACLELRISRSQAPPGGGGGAARRPVGPRHCSALPLSSVWGV